MELRIVIHNSDTRANLYPLSMKTSNPSNKHLSYWNSVELISDSALIGGEKSSSKISLGSFLTRCK